MDVRRFIVPPPMDARRLVLMSGLMSSIHFCIVSSSSGQSTHVRSGETTSKAAS